jgi:hypothetical protein
LAKPTQAQRDREQELAAGIQAAKAKLLTLLLPDEQKSARRHGSAYPVTFEDNAADLARTNPRVGEALAVFQNAVNALWLDAIERELPESLSHSWRKKHCGHNRLPFADISAEALFALRYAILHFLPGGDATLETFARRGVHQHLTEWAAQQGCVELPQKEARRISPAGYQRSIVCPASSIERNNPEVDTNWTDKDSAVDVVFDEEGLHYDPWPLINAALDGEVTEDDL